MDEAFAVVFEEDRESAGGNDVEGGGSEQCSVQKQSDDYGPGYESSEFTSPPASPEKRKKPEGCGTERQTGSGRKKGSTNIG